MELNVIKMPRITVIHSMINRPERLKDRIRTGSSKKRLTTRYTALYFKKRNLAVVILGRDSK